MIFSQKNKEGNRAVNLTYIDGIETYGRGTAVEVSINEANECLTVKSRAFKKADVHLKLNQIIGVKVVSEKEIIEKSKNTVGRAVVGGVLLGSLGAIVGGMSGIGSKQKSETHYFMVINYKSRSEEIKVLSFEIVGASLHWSSFVKELRSKINAETLENEEVYL
ncbi:hypothetical protein [Clostridium botulinum]|uniref:hypothetical protein n=1 Tax=Clostridium botulinum TaxID=1491 RepID=UPI000A17583E|nr:hypothetical protein [Clostridium botulinum]AUN11565.1 hypothetical protein RSJ6_14075 [Clostridium botulinum]OSA71582.1 hypothetical protein B2H87_05880 [Clostridium botulinum]